MTSLREMLVAADRDSSLSIISISRNSPAVNEIVVAAQSLRVPVMAGVSSRNSKLRLDFPRQGLSDLNRLALCGKRGDSNSVAARGGQPRRTSGLNFRLTFDSRLRGDEGVR